MYLLENVLFGIDSDDFCFRMLTPSGNCVYHLI